MLQRGLAILLSICMLAGGISDTAYAMSPQPHTTADSGVQNVSEAEETLELPAEDAAADPETENTENPETDQADQGENSGNGDDGAASGSGDNSTENEPVEGEGTTGSGSGDNTTEDGSGEAVEDDNAGDDVTGGETDGDDATGSDDTSGDGTAGDDTTEDGSGSENDTDQDAAEEDDDTMDGDSDSDADGDEADEEATENEDGSIDEEIEDGEESLVEEPDSLTEDSASVLSIKEEELTLTIDAPQVVTLAAKEQQWLSFTAPQDGLYRFYSTADDDSWDSKYVYLFHEKTDDGTGSFDENYASGKNGNFDCSYRMEKDETLYLLVEFGDNEKSGTFTVNAEKVEVPELTVTKNAEGSYTLQSDSYRLNLTLAPSYSQVKAGVELQQADGSAITDGSYKIYYRYSYDNRWGGTSNSYMEADAYSFNNYKTEGNISGIAAGGRFLITELQICDSDKKILTSLRANEQEIAVNTLATEKQGVLTQVSAEDASITVKVEMMSDVDGRLRYRKKKESEWTYYEDTIHYYSTYTITLGAEPDTDYVIELTAMDMETVYDTAEIRTEAFAAADIKVEAVDITSSSAQIKVTIGGYTGNKRYICARVSYTDSMGDRQTSTRYIYTSNIADNSINMRLSNLEAGKEYKDLEVELDDTDSYSMEYAAYRAKVSFTTAASAITAEQIGVTVTPDAEDSSKAVLKVTLQDVTEGSYSYTAKYRVAGSKDWQGSGAVYGRLDSYDSYADEKNLTYLMGSTEYEVQIIIDGILKTTSFMTAPAAVAVKAEVKPLMQGVQVAAELTGTETLSGTYSMSAWLYDETAGVWKSTNYADYSSTRLTADNNWKSTAVFYSADIRPNAVNEWKIQIQSDSTGTIYEKYFTLEAVRQDVTLAIENNMPTSVRIRAALAVRDESIIYTSANMYYREKGAAHWIRIGSCSYGLENGDTEYLSGLKEDTEYEARLVPNKHPDDILAQLSFRTLKDTRSVSVSVGNARYTSAQINWIFDSGANVLNSSSYICIYYREKDTAAWHFVDSEWRNTTYTGKEILTDLEEGTSYEVLVELKGDSSSSTAGQNVVREAKTEFATAAVDHILKAESTAEEMKATSAAFDVQVSKLTGVLVNRTKAVITLVSADGSSIQSETVYLNQDNQYKTKLSVNDLLPGTKYAVSGELYESESNTWIHLKNYDLGEVTTSEAKAPVSLVISETELLINKGTTKKLAVTAQPEEAAVGLTWASSDKKVATVGRDGMVTAREAGEADITVSGAAAADGNEKVSAVCHVTVRDYAIRVKNADGSYDSISGILSKAQKRTMVVYDGAAGTELSGVTWASSNPNAAKISSDGQLEPQNYGKAYITAKTADGITLKTREINVVNEIQGFSITRPEAGNSNYPAVRTAEAAYQVAAGESYSVGCVLSPAYTDLYSSSISMAANRFDWTVDSASVSVDAPGNGDLAEIRIPEAVTGQVKVTAVMKDEEYKDKNFTITLQVLRKPEVEAVPATYTWLDYSNKLKDAGLPENWQWKEQDTLIYEAGTKRFTARYVETGYYPYETGVTVHAERIGNTLSVKQTGADGKDSPGSYSTSKKAYIVKKETPLKLKAGVSAGNTPALLYAQGAFAPAAKDTAKVSVSAPDAEGYSSFTASVKGTYTVSAAVALKKAAFEKKNGAYALTEGAKVKDTMISVKFMAVDNAPIQKITFAVAEDSPEKVTIAADGTIEYEITAANADTKQKERIIHLDVTAADADGNRIENPNINYSVSDTAIVKLKKEGTDRLVLTIPKNTDGLARIVATAKDELGYSKQFAVRVKDYTPRVTTFKTTLNENYTDSVELAQIVLPYEKDGNDEIQKISLVETNSKEAADEAAGLAVSMTGISGRYKYRIYLNVAQKDKIKQTGNLNYYLAITTKAYGGLVFVPVQIKLETGMPAVTVKQSGKVNVFYTDTTHLSGYDSVSMGAVEISSSALIDSVRWVAGSGSEATANTEFVIEEWFSSNWKNGKHFKRYMIQQNRPVLDGSKKPSDAAVKGTVYIRLAGYQDEIKSPFTIQTVYKKPKLKAADYKVCPPLGEVSDHQYIYTNAAKSGNYMAKGSSTVWRGYSDIVCADQEVEVVENSNVSLRYEGTKDKKTQLTLYSDYWYESLTVPVKVKVAKSKVKLSPASVTLNAAYPSETTQTTAAAWVYNAATGSRVDVSDFRIEGANAQAQQLLDQSLLNIDFMNSHLSVSANYANAMGSRQFKPGNYKYKLTPCYGDTELNSVTLAVKIIDKAAAVKVKAKGTIDLLKLNSSGNGYSTYSTNFVTITPAFQNLDSSYSVTGVRLEGAYKDLFSIEWYSDGSIRIIPATTGRLKAGKNYTLSVTYTIKDASGEGGEMITLTSNTFNIKPKQSVPKVTSSVKQLTLFASAKGESKAETMYLYVPHSDYKKGYYAIQSASGSLDVNKDGKADLIVSTMQTTASSGRAQIAVYVLDADAVKASAKGTGYKIPVTVRCVGRDGVSKDASTTVSVVVKK